MMNRQDRAKQFAPFDALNGLREALAKKEYDLGKVERGEHSEELDSEISDKLSFKEGTESHSLATKTVTM